MSNKQHTELNDNNLAIAYYRYSSHSQRDASIEQQREAAQKLAKSRGYKIVKEYTDRAISGTTADRPGYQQMLSEVGKLRPAALILWKADRLGRDRYNVAIARKTLRDAGCRVIYVADNLPEDDSPEAAIIESLVDAMSEMYSKQLSANVKRGSRHNAERALSNGHKIYGYGTDDKTKRYIIDQDTAPIVRKIFSDYASGKRL